MTTRNGIKNSDPSLVSQARAILEAASALQNQLDEASLPQPSFSPAGRRNWTDALHLPDLLETRLKLLDAAQTMLDLTMGPLDTLVYLTGPANTKIEVLRTLNELAVADHVPLDGDINIAELAEKLQVDAGILERHLRCAYLMGIFRESRLGHVAHTGTSAAMPDFSPYTALRLGNLLQRGNYHGAEAMRVLPNGSKDKRLVAVELADKQNGSRGMWKQLAEEDPDGKGMDKFSAGMRVVGSALAGGSYLSFVQGFDWIKFGKGPLVDVGGGNGHISINVAKEFPELQIIVQDLESNSEPAKQYFKQHSLEDRAQFQKQDFFEAQPTDLKPAAYLLSRVLHDWQDPDCVRILKPLLPAMEKFGTKLLIIDRILPDNVGDLPPSKEWPSRAADILMYTLFSAGERSLKDFKALLKQVDGRLKVLSCNQPFNTVFGFMEIDLDTSGVCLRTSV